MTTIRISGGVVHNLPADLRKALASDVKALAAWEDITPLARNEWICWTISVKKDETRGQHVERVCSELKEGMHESLIRLPLFCRETLISKSVTTDSGWHECPGT